MRATVSTLVVVIGLGALGSPIARSAQGPDCSWLTYQEEGQEWLDSVSRDENLRFMMPNFDPDGNGIACEELPSRATRFHPGDTIPLQAVKAQVTRGINAGTFGVRILGPGGSDEGSLETVRLLGVSVPEIRTSREEKECFGLRSSRAAWMMLSGRDAVVWLERDGSDRDAEGRLLRYVWFEGERDHGPYLANELLMREGYAVADPQPPDGRYDDRLAAAQAAAATDGLGLWGACGGPHVPVGSAPGYSLPTGDVDCGSISADYAQWLLAQDPSDPNGLDADGDGIACE
jgi:micrococcal nuclease